MTAGPDAQTRSFTATGELAFMGKTLNLPVTGTLDPQTWEALERRAAIGERHVNALRVLFDGGERAPQSHVGAAGPGAPR